jgi:hypothetical protein
MAAASAFAAVSMVMPISWRGRYSQERSSLRSTTAAATSDSSMPAVKACDRRSAKASSALMWSLLASIPVAWWIWARDDQPPGSAEVV